MKKVNKFSNKDKDFKVKWKMILMGVFFVVISFFVFKIYNFVNRSDIHCKTQHTPTISWPARLKTAGDFFQQGDYLYEKGDCGDAITAYTRAVTLSSKYSEAYNNRAYTYMRMGEYQKALLDLNKAIELRPDYARALMNRGNIYNYYLIDRTKAVEDYNKVLALPDQNESNLCRHRLLAMNNGWKLNVFWQILTKGTKAGCL